MISFPFGIFPRSSLDIPISSAAICKNRDRKTDRTTTNNNNKNRQGKEREVGRTWCAHALSMSQSPLNNSFFFIYSAAGSLALSIKCVRLCQDRRSNGFRKKDPFFPVLVQFSPFIVQGEKCGTDTNSGIDRRVILRSSLAVRSKRKHRPIVRQAIIVTRRRRYPQENTALLSWNREGEKVGEQY